MGLSMCGHVLEAGYPVAVYSRTRERAEPLLERGADWASSPAAVAAAADVVFTMVGFPVDVREVVLGPEGVLSGARPGMVLVDTTTSDPSLAREIDEAARAVGAASVDAPVSGGDVGARNATLSIMVGGDDATVERVRPLLEVVGQTIVHQGPAGAGQHTKMVNQILIAGGMIGVCEALLYAYRAGLDLEAVLSSVSGGGPGSWAPTNHAPRPPRRGLQPGVFVERFIQDMEIALSQGRRMDFALSGGAPAPRPGLRPPP